MSGDRIDVDATTRVCAVIGSPIAHSLSPVLMNAAFAETGLNWMFCAFDIDLAGAPGALDAMRVLDIGGYSVTMPLKERVVDFVDELSSTASKLAAVNCIVNDRGRLVGHSTDGPGLVDTLRIDEGFDPDGTCCVVIGAGGAARAAVAALADAGAKAVVVVNRTVERAERAAALAGNRGRVGSAEDIARADLIVNATPIGMRHGTATAMPFDPDRVGAGQTVFDMVYEPIETPIVTASRAGGAHAVGGLGMLVHQAARAFELWTHQEAPIDAMSRAADQALARRAT